MNVTKLDGISEYRLAAEWYAHPSAKVWKEILYPRFLENILAGLKAAPNEDARAKIQGAYILLCEVNAALSSAEKNIAATVAKAEANQLHN